MSKQNKNVLLDECLIYVEEPYSGEKGLFLVSVVVCLFVFALYSFFILY